MFFARSYRVWVLRLLGCGSRFRIWGAVFRVSVPTTRRVLGFRVRLAGFTQR